MKNRIRELRLERGLLQRDVAEKLGVSTQSYGNYENWINKPDPETLSKLADLFAVSVDYLLCREDEFRMPTQKEAISRGEWELLEAYRALPPELQSLAAPTLRSWKK